MWLYQHTHGRSLRLDSSQGSLDITFARLRLSEAELLATGRLLRNEIEHELAATNLIQAGKLYAVYYDGASADVCGGGAFPPLVDGVVASIYLRGRTQRGDSCDDRDFADVRTAPGYWEFSILHELLHTMGLVPTNAPHYLEPGHVTDDRRDLMYSGPLPWTPSFVDVNKDDYWAKLVSSEYLDWAGSDLDTRFVLPDAFTDDPMTASTPTRSGLTATRQGHYEPGGPAGEATTSRPDRSF
ncbi:MAG TPA: hypothetical protein VJS92_11120 [Candidatus Polarisedimenticolaceae bacterium]|nr:hypothetical protein [Candidatus Polarisedimenticolaceae bacterium]